MSSNQDARGLDLRSYLDQIVKDPLDKFNVFTTWTENDKKEFKVLLDNLKKPYDSVSETKKEKGDRLERLVEFIIRKTYFFEIYKNVHTETNEIDEVIILSNRGKQAIHSLDLSRDLIPIDQDLFLGECKNYSSNLSVTYVGKPIAMNINQRINGTREKRKGEPMIEFSIHPPSILIGFFIGYVAIATIFILICFSEKWDNGFNEGWKAGKKFAEDRMKEKEGKTDEPNNKPD